jgi:ompA family protein
MSEKCIKCSKIIPDEQVSRGKQTSQGFVCADCNRKKRGGLLIGALAATVFLGTGGYWWYNSQSKQTQEAISQIEIEGYGGVGKANDEVSPNIQDEFVFKWENVLPISSPLANVGGTADNLEDFRRQMEENLKNAEANKATQIAIPPVGMLFKKGSYILEKEGGELLKEFAKTFLQTNGQATLLVEGYACDLGIDRLNDRLSEKRAQLVKKNLVEAGIPTDKIEVKSYGESQYGTVYQTREENRRVNVSVK